jgi:5-(carboxyamino)imidazole ribonucleotide synthase
MINPGAWLGVMGGGQLGRMFVHAAQAMGYRVCVLEPSAGAPAGVAADQQVVAAYDDVAGLGALAQRCVAVTTEFENVPAQSLAYLESRVSVHPSSVAVSAAQDRALEKKFILSCGVDVAPFVEMATDDDLRTVSPTLFPAILKTARLGYDGKGQVSVNHPDALASAWQTLGQVPCVLEKKLPLKREISVIVARTESGQTALFPVCENEHRQGILARTIMPARIRPELAREAGDLAVRIANGLGYVGVLCIEMFELNDGRVLVNEMAPRPHNSGHATIDACDCNQFEMQVRCLANLPLTTPQQLAPAVMLNILGDIWFDADGAAREPDWASVLAIPGVRLHLYGKEEARRGRKMGHLTVVAPTLDQAMARAQDAAVALDMANGH